MFLMQRELSRIGGSRGMPHYTVWSQARKMLNLVIMESFFLQVP